MPLRQRTVADLCAAVAAVAAGMQSRALQILTRRRSMLPAAMALAIALASVTIPQPARSEDATLAEQLCAANPAATDAAARAATAEAANLIGLITENAPVYEAVRAIVVDRDGVDAFAHHCLNGGKMVVFGQSFLQRLRNTARGTGPYWSWVFVAAHEVGHIWRNHGNLRLPCTPEHPNYTYCACRPGMPEAHAEFNRRLELEADFFAGFVLSRLGAAREDALSAMHVLDTHDTCTHPGRERRAEAVTRGWLQAKGGVGSAPLKGTADDLARFELALNRDIYGGDIRELFGISIEACAKACLANSACGMFSFDRWYNACFLKSTGKIARSFNLTGFPETRRLGAADRILKREPKSTIGIRRELVDGMAGLDETGKVVTVRVKERSFFDKPQRTAAADDWSDCAAACRGDGQCIAFNFFERTCELFDAAEGHYPAPGRSIGYVWVQNQ